MIFAKPFFASITPIDFILVQTGHKKYLGHCFGHLPLRVIISVLNSLLKDIPQSYFFCHAERLLYTH